MKKETKTRSRKKRGGERPTGAPRALAKSAGDGRWRGGAADIARAARQIAAAIREAECALRSVDAKQEGCCRWVA